MARWLVLVAACLVLAAGALAMPEDKAVVTTQYGPVRGVLTDGVYAWRGVPYGASTAGANRFRPPVPPAPWSQVRDATQWGPGCPQYAENADAPTKQDEDCLHVNVFAPVGANRLPVMVWIHGGGFSEGSNIGPYEVYDGRAVARAGSVVVISINYRLASLGFMVSPDDPKVAGNMGFMDQIMALKWVKANAAAFGGDPAQVTLWGESAGAMSIGLHQTSPASQGLFARVIQQSNPLSVTFKDKRAAGVLGGDVCKRLSCKPCTLECLQRAPLKSVLSASKASANSILVKVAANYRRILSALLDFVPTVDGVLVPSQVMPALERGAQKTPMIIGSNADEGITFVYSALKSKLSNLAVEAGLVLLFPLHARSMLKFYTRPGDTDGREPFSRFVTDHIFTCSSQRFAVSATKQNVPAYVYHYEHVFSAPDLFKGLIPDRCATAVCHAVELAVVFGNGQTGSRHFSPEEVTLSSNIIKYFTNFARTGNPNGPGVPAWPQFDVSKRNVLALGRPGVAGGVGPVTSFADRCAMWDKIGYGTGKVSFRQSFEPDFTLAELEAAESAGLPVSLFQAQSHLHTAEEQEEDEAEEDEEEEADEQEEEEEDEADD